MQLLPDERIDDLQLNGLKIIQNPNGFCFGMDAVLLSDFASVKKNARVLDIGTGTGVLPLLLSAKCKAAHYVGIDIYPQVADMAQRSVLLNGLSDIIEIKHMDLRQAPCLLGRGRFDYVVCNPPYSKQNAGEVSKKEIKAIARHELNCTLEDIIETSAKVLNNMGKAAYIIHSHRFYELLRLMDKHGLEPKRIRMVHSYVSRPSKLMLVEGVLGGRPYVHWMPSLIIYNDDGSYTQELQRIYNGGCNEG